MSDGGLFAGSFFCGVPSFVNFLREIGLLHREEGGAYEFATVLAEYTEISCRGIIGKGSLAMGTSLEHGEDTHRETTCLLWKVRDHCS